MTDIGGPLTYIGGHLANERGPLGGTGGPVADTGGPLASCLLASILENTGRALAGERGHCL